MELNQEAFSRLQKLQNENAELQARLEQLKKMHSPQEDEPKQVDPENNPKLLEQQYEKERDEIKNLKGELARLESRKASLEKNLEKVLKEYHENQIVEKAEDEATKKFYDNLIDKCAQYCGDHLAELKDTISKYTNTRTKVFNVTEEYEKVQRMINFINMQKEDVNTIESASRGVSFLVPPEANAQYENSNIGQLPPMPGDPAYVNHVKQTRRNPFARASVNINRRYSYSPGAME